MTTLGTGAGLAGAALLGAAVALMVRRRRSDAELERTRRELNRRLNELFALQEMSYLLSESLQLDHLVEQVARFVSRFVEAGGVLVGMVTDSGAFRVGAALGSVARLNGTEWREGETGLLGQAMGRERLELAESEGDGLVDVLPGVPVHRAAVAPLRAHGVTVGAVAVVDREAGPFRVDDLRLLSTVATHAAIALANARFFNLVRVGKEQWETTFDALTEGIAVVGLNDGILRANRGLASLLDKPLPSVVGLNIAEALLGGAPALHDLLQQARQGTAPAPLIRPSESLGKVLRITAAAMRDGSEDDLVVVLVEDVTEQQAIEAQLIQSEKMAAVGQLVSGVAHELNNPLTSIAGLSEFLLEQPAPTEHDRDHLRVIHEQAERAGRIVRNLLTFARKGPADLGPVDLNDVVQRTVLLVGYEIKLREVSLETRYDMLPMVQGDRYQLQQVILNLITNAVQAVAAAPPERPRRILVTTRHEGTNAVLRIADSGPGIPDEMIPKVFDPFFTTKGPGEGTGLGLSISFGIIAGHGGRLSLQRSEWGGALFTISLPAAAPLPGPTTTPALAAPPAPRPPRPSGRTVLVVDDDPAVRRVLSILFANDGQRVETARDAAHAVEILSGTRYDLVIADPRAAVSPGEMFAERLLTRWPELRDRTIFVTADVRPETTAWLDGLGCRYFRKPFNIAEVKQAAEEMLREQVARA